MDEYLGIVKLFAGNFVPRGWMLCDGSILSIAQNQALFSLLGTMYGGNGSTTFALPDLRGRVAIGAGDNTGHTSYIPGQMAGTESVILTQAQLPAHTHTGAIAVSSQNATKSQAESGGTLAAPGVQEGRSFNPTFGYTKAPTDTELNIDTVKINQTGGSAPFSIMQPYTGMNYIICVAGIFPSRQ